MKNQQHVSHAIRVPSRPAPDRTPKMLMPKPAQQFSSSSPSPTNGGYLTLRHHKSLPGFGRRNPTFTHIEAIFNEISKAVKRKLSSGTKRLLRRAPPPCEREGEKLSKAFRCCLSTTAGPIQGHLLISADRIAFCSEKSIKFSSKDGEFVWARYRVSIPMSKVLEANEGQNVKRPRQKYIQIVTVDDFEFWFMGLLSHRKALNCLHQTIFQSQ